MDTRNVIWPFIVRRKLMQFRNERFTPEETLDFVLQLIQETEEFLKNDAVGQSYTEEFGKYKGLSRMVIKRFRIYYQRDQANIIVLAILFPGEN